MIRNAYFRRFLLLGLISCCLPSCAEEVRPGFTGEQLAQAHCASCHLYPDPSLLDTERWRQVLPNMGYRLGMYREVDRDSLILSTDMRGVDTTRLFPAQPLVTPSEWEKIEAFYLSAAPDGMEPVRRRQALRPGLAHFVVRVPRWRFETPLTLLTKMQPDNQWLFLGNYGNPSTLVVINPAGQVLYEWNLVGAPVRAHGDAGRLYVLLAGPGPEPTEASAGSILVIDRPEALSQAPPRTLLGGLKRPVDMDLADLNGDGIKDFIICEYGHEAGFLSLYTSEASGDYRRRVLSAEPGAVRAVVHDFDEDGLPDIGVLMAQGDEGFDIYTNDGAGGFTRHRKLRFPPVFGSNDVQLADFNADGRMDLLYVNGDNADYTRVVKPYHGLRLYLADEAGEYQEALFFPLPGAYSARAGDFDADGDLDIAAISYFPDYLEAPEQGFVYLENKGGLNFEGHTMPYAQRGRWMTMDAGDLDADGDLDLLLGSNIGFSPQGDTTGLFQRWIREAPSFVWLENTLR